MQSTLDTKIAAAAVAEATYLAAVAGLAAIDAAIQSATDPRAAAAALVSDSAATFNLALNDLAAAAVAAEIPPPVLVTGS